MPDMTIHGSEKNTSNMSIIRKYGKKMKKTQKITPYLEQWQQELGVILIIQE